MKNKTLLLILLILVIFAFFFNSFLIKGKLPIPSDTIIGLYHPFRDLYAKEYPRGIPFKNFLITDPVRQQYPWRELAISLEKKGELPLWNPYNMGGYPLLANFQSAAFYPLNILFFVLPFNISWGLLIFLSPLLSAIFLYFYLKNLNLHNWACFLGSIVFSFSGFFIAWMEWGTITHTILWLPLILLSIDKIFSYFKFNKNSKVKSQSSRPKADQPLAEKLQLKSQKLLIWSFIFTFSLISAFFAGHLQIFFYLFVFSTIYLFARWLQFGRRWNILLLFAICYLLFAITTAIQWVPTLKFIFESAREIDQAQWQKSGWFMPWEHLVQFIIPDFFGNPTTNNYWGVWNYAEFIGYIGIFPFILSLFALFFRKDKKTLFFGTIFFISLIFALPTFFAKIPYLINIPLLSTSQPTRLLFLSDFALAVLSALGFDYLIKSKNKTVIFPLLFLFILFLGIWIFVLFLGKEVISLDNLNVAKRNSILPSALFGFILIIVSLLVFMPRIKKYSSFIYILLIFLALFDLMRFGFKFIPFTNKEYLFPQTKTISFLQSQKGIFRIMSADRRILPPNFTTLYRLQSVDGYDPLFLNRYGELISASERGKPDISPPFGFDRIINPANFESRVVDLIGVKYILSLSDLKSEKLKKVFQEGQTRVYENSKSFPRTFFVEKVYYRNNKNDVIELIFNENFDLKRKAIIEDADFKRIDFISKRSLGEAKIKEYTENKIVIKTQNKGEGFLVITDTFYPAWKAKINGKETRIYRTDFNFRGIFVPKGEHNVEFYVSLF